MRTAPGQQVVREPIDIRAELAGWGASGIVGDYTNDGIRYLRRQVVTNARWTPLLETYDRYGRPRGAAAALMLNHGGFYAGSNWAYFGVENVDLFKDPSSPMAKALQEVARFLVRGTFLRQVATEFRLYRPGETVKASAVVDNRGGRAQPVSVRFTVSAVDSDAPTATVTEQVVLAPGASQEVQVALGPVASGPDLRRVACTLLADGAAIDELTTGFVVESAETVGSAAELRFAGNYFTRNGRAMFLFGSDETAYVYLTPHENPLTWSRDLLAARDIGMDIYENLQYSNPGHEMLEADWRNFRAMGQLIQKHNMVFMPGMLIVHNVAAGDAALAEQRDSAKATRRTWRQCRDCSTTSTATMATIRMNNRKRPRSFGTIGFKSVTARRITSAPPGERMPRLRNWANSRTRRRVRTAGTTCRRWTSRGSCSG